MKYIGAMTGTSVDGLDLALLEVGPRGAATLVAAETTPLPDGLAASLKALAAPGADEVVRVGVADAALGEFIGQAVLARLAHWATAAADIRAIGSHGQTIRHHPQASPPFTVQIGDPNRIAEITGIDTVADFRRRDIAAGGEGAPLTPLFHDALFRDAVRHRAVVNIGGIANATMLPGGSTSLLGFDTGPGNALLDAWMQTCNGEPFDRDGAWAAGGKMDERLLATLQADPFVHRQPPKSTGKEIYHRGYIEQACGAFDIPPQNVQATLAEFTAWSIAAAITRWGPPDGDVIVCGGGRRNAHLMRRLATRIRDHAVLASEDLGVDGDALEAAAFAWFAHRTIAGLAGNAPTVTGARGPRILGAVYPGRPPR